MKSFTKKILVTALLLSSTSALAFGFGSIIDWIPGVTFPGQESTLSDKAKLEATQELSTDPKAESQFRFKNESAGDNSYEANVTISFLKKDPNSEAWITKYETIKLPAGGKGELDIEEGAQFVNVVAADKEGKIILNRNLCTYNNNYYKSAEGAEGASTRKDISFHGGEFGKARAVMYFSYAMERDGFKDVNLEVLECWTSRPTNNG